jgi:hypothetical protein
MRCPDCNKFVGLEMQEPEVDGDPEVSKPEDGEVGITLEVRIVRACDQCGTELKEANFTLEAGAEMPPEHRGEGHELEATADVEGTERSDGKPGTPGRYRRSFYGVEASFAVRCSCQKADDPPIATAHAADEVQASGMDELT